MQFDKDFIERKQSELHAKYGVHVDRSIVVMILQMQDELKEDSELLNAAAQKINSSQKTFQPQNSAQAFWHGMGSYGLALIITGLLCIGLYFYRTQSQTVTASQSLATFDVSRNDSVFALMKAPKNIDYTNFLKSASIQPVLIRGEYYISIGYPKTTTR